MSLLAPSVGSFPQQREPLFSRVRRVLQREIPAFAGMTRWLRAVHGIPLPWGRGRRGAPGEGAFRRVLGVWQGPLTLTLSPEGEGTTRLGPHSAPNYVVLHIPCRGSFIVSVRR